MNWSKALIAGVVAGIVLWLANFLMHGVIMAETYMKYPVFTQEQANPVWFLVITAATQTKLSDKFFTLRVCTAKLPGLEQPAELFTAYPATEAANIKSRLDQYSHALALFESGELEEAETLLRELTSQGKVTPAQFLSHYTAAQKNGNLGRRAVDKYAAGQGPVIEIHSK